MILRGIDASRKKKTMIKKCYKIQPKDIVLVQFIIEGYEGMATATTLDSRKAIIQIAIMPDYIQEMLDILEDLKYRYNIEEITDGPLFKRNV